MLDNYWHIILEQSDHCFSQPTLVSIASFCSAFLNLVESCWNFTPFCPRFNLSSAFGCSGALLWKTVSYVFTPLMILKVSFFVPLIILKVSLLCLLKGCFPPWRMLLPYPECLFLWPEADLPSLFLPSCILFQVRQSGLPALLQTWMCCEFVIITLSCIYSHLIAQLSSSEWVLMGFEWYNICSHVQTMILLLHLLNWRWWQ